MKDSKELEKESLAYCAKYIDNLFGIEKVVVEGGVGGELNFSHAVSDIMSASTYNFRAGMAINLYSFVPQHLMEIALRLAKAEKGGFYALGGMTAGRWYKDKSGEEFKFIGKVDSGANKDRLLFSDGQKSVYKDLEDFEGGKPKETKLFGFFEEGGMLIHGFQQGDTILEIYKGYGIVENNNNGVIEVLNPNRGTRFIIDLDESKPTGIKSMGMSKDEQMESAKRYIDYLDKPLPDTLLEKFRAEGKMEKGGYMADGGMMDVVNAEISTIKRNIMGTTSFVMKIKGMRNPQDFIVYPISADQAGQPIMIQSDTRIGFLDLSSGRGLMSQSHANGAYRHHFTMDKKVPFKISETDLQRLKEHISGTAGSSVGSMGISSDNSGASMMAKGGEINYTKKWKVVGITMQGKRFEKEITLGRMSDRNDVMNALKRMPDTQIREITFIGERFKAADGGSIPNNYEGKTDKEYVVADMNYNIMGSFDTENEAQEYSKKLSRKDGEIYRFGNKQKIERFAKEDGYMAKGGELEFKNSNLYLNGFGLDSNGNSVVKVSFPNQRAFSIQTNGVLNETNSLYTKKIGDLTDAQIKTIEKEVVEYVKQFGSKEQKQRLKTYSGYMADGGLVVKSDEDLREVAKYMAKAVKKRWDLKDLVYYFEQENNYDYKYRVKIWDEMNVWEMKKTEENIYKVLKAIVEANEQGGVMAKGGMTRKGGQSFEVNSRKFFYHKDDGNVYDSNHRLYAGSYDTLEQAKKSLEKNFEDIKKGTFFKDGGMMAKGGFVSKGELVWRKLTNAKKMEFLKENFTPEITPRSQETLVGKDYNFLPKNVKIKFEAKYANVEDYAMGGKVKFADKVKSVQESLLKRKKVDPQVQKDYGKTYSKAEAKESAQRIVGSRMAQLKEKMAKKKK